MNIDKEDFKQLLRKVHAVFETMSVELAAYRFAIEGTRVANPNDPLPEFVENAKTDPQLIARIHAVLEPVLQRTLEQVDRLDSDQQMQQFLRRWSPEMPVN